MPSTSTTSTAASTHQAKRPYAGSHSQTHTRYQSNITSYFPSTPTTISQTSASRNDSITNPSSPVLPALVQSNLLSVGMRVRKSVPEGYKTGLPQKNPLGFPCNNSATAIPTAVAYNSGAGSGSARRELAPFCGIMKVGGLAVQSWSDSDDREWDDVHTGEGEDEVPGKNDVPFLSSQGSTISAVSVDSRMGFKRRFEEEEDQEQEQEEEPEVVAYDIWRDPDEDVQLSPKTRPVDLAPRLGLGRGGRAVVVPKSRRKGQGGRDGAFKSAILEGQENDNRAVLDVDFGDAEFMDWSSCLT